MFLISHACSVHKQLSYEAKKQIKKKPYFESVNVFKLSNKNFGTDQWLALSLTMGNFHWWITTPSHSPSPLKKKKTKRRNFICRLTALNASATSYGTPKAFESSFRNMKWFSGHQSTLLSCQWEVSHIFP